MCVDLTFKEVDGCAQLILTSQGRHNCSYTIIREKSEVRISMVDFLDFGLCVV